LTALIRPLMVECVKVTVFEEVLPTPSEVITIVCVPGVSA
jgi:hypothetical protein